MQYKNGRIELSTDHTVLLCDIIGAGGICDVSLCVLCLEVHR